MDFYQIKERSTKNGVLEIYPDFKVCRSKDLMIRGKSFYAIWDEEKQLWSTDEYDVQRMVDNDLYAYRDKMYTHDNVIVKAMNNFSSRTWVEFKNYIANLSDNSHQLDERLTFSNTETKKKDYVSRKLPYPLEKGTYQAFDEIIGTLYDSDERAKIEWAIGAVISGDARHIQKFLVLYGEAGTGKSTILNIVQKLFVGYYITFEAKAITSSGNAFATEVFKNDPLVAIQHDGDLSRIEDNTKLNSIVSHEEMTMNEKYKPSYTAKVNCFLFMGTNKPVKITDAKSGIIRRLIDVKPSGNIIPSNKYETLMSQIDFELSGIACHCLEVYKSMGKNYYNGYRPTEMILQTDVFYNFVEANYFILKEQNNITLSHAYDIYKQYCDDSLVEFKLPRHKFREELKNYYKIFYDMTRVDGKQVRSYYADFIFNKFQTCKMETIAETPSEFLLDSTVSILDEVCKNCKAQYANKKETPNYKWSDVETKLKDLDSRKLHYVKLPKYHIVIDFDLKDESGNKSLALNLEAASKWPTTYAEFSKSGSGIHLHYIYDGDVEKLQNIYEKDIEIKTFLGNSSLRRMFTMCNNKEISTISSGLPLKGEKVINFETVKNEQTIRKLIQNNLKKQYHPGTKPSMDFIHKILEDAYAGDVPYDVSDMLPKIMVFANNSSNQAEYCLKLLPDLKVKSKDTIETLNIEYNKDTDDDIVFFDTEVFPNLFVVIWKKINSEHFVHMINPLPKDIELLLTMKLVGFNNRRYDNHILYGAYIGLSNYELYKLSQKIVKYGSGFYSEAYNLSYTDIYDFASAANKKSLKKFEIELGIHHQELGFSWDEPVPEDKWIMVADYCNNDVFATEATFHHLSGDWTARKIVAELSGLTRNDMTNQHSTKIIFGDNKNPQSEFVYPNLAEEFPGYKFEDGKSTYRGEVVGEGGYVYAEPGIHHKIPVLDLESGHPSTIERLGLFGPRYTKRFVDLKNARLAIKHGRLEELNDLLDGVLVPYAKRAELGEFKLKDLSNALKTVINSIYGLTFTKFDNPFKDPRNVDNVVAKRVALFMIDLKYAVQEKGYTVAHIKTDSIKIPNATEEIIQFVRDFGKKYGYDFDVEETYEKMCLVNDSVYIAKKIDGTWSATGAQFAHPYVYKTLFSKEPIKFNDLCEIKNVKMGSIFIDMNESLPDGEHAYQFVGKNGLFTPIKSGCGGGILVRENEEKYYSINGTKGYRWLESEMVEKLKKESDIDESYFFRLVDDAKNKISSFGDFEQFVEDSYEVCGDCIYMMPDGSSCLENKNFINKYAKACNKFSNLPFY